MPVPLFLKFGLLEFGEALLFDSVLVDEEVETILVLLLSGLDQVVEPGGAPRGGVLRELLPLLQREVLEVHALLVAVFVLAELVFDAVIQEPVSSLVPLLHSLPRRLRDPRPHTGLVILGTQMRLELQLLLLKVLQGALAFLILSLKFLRLYRLEVLHVVLSRFFAGLIFFRLDGIIERSSSIMCFIF